MTTRLAAIDLNLLVALDALLAEGSVTRAGRRIGLSQPAMSHALARLRDLLGDPVLVRSPYGMRPTALAAELAPRARELCKLAERVLLERAAFSPATAERRFVVAASDYVGVVLLPELTRAMLAAAPGVQLRIRSLPGRLPIEELAAGEIDLVIGTFAGSAEAVESESLLRERSMAGARPPSGWPISLRSGRTSTNHSSRSRPG